MRRPTRSWYPRKPQEATFGLSILPTTELNLLLQPQSRLVATIRKDIVQLVAIGEWRDTLLHLLPILPVPSLLRLFFRFDGSLTLSVRLQNVLQCDVAHHDPLMVLDVV
jgi:hypothetical protein